MKKEERWSGLNSPFSMNEKGRCMECHGRLDQFAKFIPPFIICNELYPLGPLNAAPVDCYWVIFESWRCLARHL